MQKTYKEKLKLHIFGLIGFLGFVLGISFILYESFSVYNNINKAINKNSIVETYISFGMRHKYFYSSIDMVYIDKISGRKITSSIHGNNNILVLKNKDIKSLTLYPEKIFFVPLDYTKSIKLFYLKRIIIYFSFLLLIIWCINLMIFKIRKILFFEKP